jgi:pimeloyl-ACP methyl ester carboxylesterase
LGLRLLVVGIALAVVVPTAAARSAPGVASTSSGNSGSKLVWYDCADGFECSSLKVPRDYDRPNGPTFEVAITRLPARDQAHRIGPLFVNFGGPGGTAVDSLHAFGADLFFDLNERFDIVGVDPRGVGRTQPSVDCKANQETHGIYSKPFWTPFNLDVKALVRQDRDYLEQCLELNGNVLRYITTGNTARDMDRVREAMGERKLSYLGYSYGTFLGSTYATLFPNRYRALVLDGPVDVDGWVNRPMENLREQSDGFERALGRFFQACAADETFCTFGGSDPWGAFDQLVDRANASPLPATGDDPRSVDGEDVLAATLLLLYAKQAWPFLAETLQEADAGDGTLVRELANAFFGNNGDGTFDPFNDLYFLITAADQVYEHDDIDLYLDAGNHSWGLFEHTWFNAGYTEALYGQYDPRPNGVYRGPFRASRRAPTALVVVTRYDPATPFRGGLRTAAELGNTRLLTMNGDGHTAYGGNSPCIDEAVDAYLESLTLPAEGTICEQNVPFPAAAFARTRSSELPDLWRARPSGWKH